MCENPLNYDNLVGEFATGRLNDETRVQAGLSRGEWALFQALLASSGGGGGGGGGSGQIVSVDAGFVDANTTRVIQATGANRDVIRTIVDGNITASTPFGAVAVYFRKLNDIGNADVAQQPIEFSDGTLKYAVDPPEVLNGVTYSTDSGAILEVSWIL